MPSVFITYGKATETEFKLDKTENLDSTFERKPSYTSCHNEKKKEDYRVRG
jgi:hypothetical protein